MFCTPGLSWLALAIASAVLALAALVPAAPAVAEEIIHVESYDDGYLLVFYDAESDRYIWLYFDSNDTFIEGGAINPNPVDGTDEAPGDWDSRLRLLLQHGGGGIAGPSFEDTPLGAYLTGHGQGIGPVFNPSDDDTHGGQSPSNSQFFDPADFYEQMFEGAGYPHGPGFDGNGGPLGGQIADAIRRGKKGSGGGSDAKPSDGGYWDESMPGPPELVNPAWKKSFGTTQTRSFGTPTLNRSFAK